VAEAYRLDPIAAATEYGAEFRKDVQAFVTEDIVSAAMTSRGWLAPEKDARYFAFCDPAGGSGSDSMTLAIAHADYARQKVILDLIVGVEPPFEPGLVVATFAGHMTRYGLRFVEGDRYAGDWPLDRFRAHSIGYQPSELTTSEIYKDWLPALMERKVDLPDDKKLRSQLLALDRRPSRGGDIIDHPKNGHDDYVTAAAGALLKAYTIGLKIKPQEYEKPMGTLEEQRAREFQAYLKGLHNPDSSGGGSKWDYLNKSGR
jgi:hypothetical protein